MGNAEAAPGAQLQASSALAIAAICESAPADGKRLCLCIPRAPITLASFKIKKNFFKCFPSNLPGSLYTIQLYS